MKKQFGLLSCLALSLAVPAYAGDFHTLTGSGFSAPNIDGSSNVGNPQIGDIIFDTSTNIFRGYGGSGPGWLGLGGGTVTSVGLSDGSSTPIYSITGSPVTNSGALTFTLATQSANTVFAGPASGSAAQPTFRALATGDFLAPTSSIATTTSHTGGMSANSSGTYTVPTSSRSPVYIRVKMVGGGGGGGSGGNGGSPGPMPGDNGDPTTFGTSFLSAGGGTGGQTTNGTSGAGGGGTNMISSPAVGSSFTGGTGQEGGGSTSGIMGGMGAASPFGGAGSGGNTIGGGANNGTNAAANTGSGGGGGGGTASYTSGQGGGAGGFIDVIIPNPTGTYLYSVGSGGSGQTGGNGGGNSGNGGDGYIEVTEYYQ